MSFAAPQAFLLLPVLLVAVVLVLLSFRWKDRMLQRLAAGATDMARDTAMSRPRQVFKAGIVFLALAAIMLAVARPYLGSTPAPARAVQADLLVALDVSLSMAAQDVTPSRLGLAKQEALALIDRLQGDRIALVVFGGAAALRFPLTYDYDAARALIRAVEVDSAPTPGTALSEGVRAALRGLRQSEAPVRAVLLLSDGEDYAGQVEEAAQEAETAGIPVYAIGVGTAQGSTIPVANPRGSGVTLKRDMAGQVVQTRMDEAPLKLLAQRTQGSYQRATSSGRELQQVYEGVTLRSEGRQPELPARPNNDLTPYFGLLGFLLLMVDLLFPERAGRSPWLRPALALAPIVLLGIVSCSQMQNTAFDLNQLGTQLYHQSRFSEALDNFRNAQVERPDLAELNLNAGDALYKSGEFERALRETQRVLSTEGSDLQAQAHFNMGNAYFQVQRYQDAFEEYKKALKENADDFDAKVNLELALRKLHEQQQSQGNQNNQQGSDDDQSGQQPNQQGSALPDSASGDQSSQQRSGTARDPAEELRRSLRDAGQDISIEEALKILDALREREQQLQTQYNQQQPDRSRGARPERDW